MEKHVIRFFRHTVSGQHCAVCTCGRSITENSLQDVQTWAACHDLQELPEQPATVPYQSGLPDDPRQKAIQTMVDEAQRLKLP